VRNAEIGPGKIALGQNQLFYRPQYFDGETENSNLFQILDKYSLQVSTHTLLWSINSNTLSILLVIVKCPSVTQKKKKYSHR